MIARLILTQGLRNGVSSHVKIELTSKGWGVNWYVIGPTEILFPIDVTSSAQYNFLGLICDAAALKGSPRFGMLLRAGVLQKYD